MTTLHPSDLHRSPNAIAADYSRFRVGERLLFTGHSHQAWPDVAFDGMTEAFNDASRLVDDKWPRAFEKADAVRRGYARLLGCPPEQVALAENTHELVIKWLSALPLKARPRIVTTDGEYHSIRRQLDRLAEEKLIELVRVSVQSTDDLAARVTAAVDDRTSAVMISSVLFRTGQIVPHLDVVARACAQHGAEILIDAYHQMNIVPFSLKGIENAYVTGAGYKYCQLGEGNAFLRLPEHCRMRPVITGWYAEFEAKEQPPSQGVAYGRGPWRFAGATYDPTSNYRAAAVFDYFAKKGLTPALLREVSQHQMRLIAERFDALGLDPGVITRDRSASIESRGGFMVLQSPRAGDICHRLHDAGVYTDYRADALRFGPAPYVSDAQIEDALARLNTVVRKLPA
ncbi:MAG TPA: aminotransferase class V-fold PLP-dependent enzyme [Candidatus Krumholzibacteria bacterium]|nr:aminotransferase class V-fold PLP-dependent enzyme [Candidatus Krumholzibacteria bacterium]